MHKLEDDYASQIETYIAAKAAFKEREEIAKEIKEARAADNHRAVDKLQAELLSAKPIKPLSPKRVYDDTTLEAFIHPMMERHPSLGLMTDEGAKLLKRIQPPQRRQRPGRRLYGRHVGRQHIPPRLSR